MIRSDSDKNTGHGDPKLMELFNNFIGNCLLREIFVSGMRFTWSNKQKIPTLIKLDRILVTVEWELQYTKCFAWAKARLGFDHCP